MYQSIFVYIIIAVALIGAVRYLWRKLQALKKNKPTSPCSSCPLKDRCASSVKPGEKGCKRDS